MKAVVRREGVRRIVSRLSEPDGTFTLVRAATMVFDGSQVQRIRIRNWKLKEIGDMMFAGKGGGENWAWS